MSDTRKTFRSKMLSFQWSTDWTSPLSYKYRDGWLLLRKIENNFLISLCELISPNNSSPQRIPHDTIPTTTQRLFGNWMSRGPPIWHEMRIERSLKIILGMVGKLS